MFSRTFKFATLKPPGEVASALSQLETGYYQEGRRRGLYRTAHITSVQPHVYDFKIAVNWGIRVLWGYHYPVAIAHGRVAKSTIPQENTIITGQVSIGTGYFVRQSIMTILLIPFSIIASAFIVASIDYVLPLSSAVRSGAFIAVIVAVSYYMIGLLWIGMFRDRFSLISSIQNISIIS